HIFQYQEENPIEIEAVTHSKLFRLDLKMRDQQMRDQHLQAEFARVSDAPRFKGEFSMKSPDLELEVDTEFALGEEQLLEAWFKVSLELKALPENLTTLAEPRIQFDLDMAVGAEELLIEARNAELKFKKHFSQ